MQISNKYVVVEKLEEEDKEGFKVADVQDDFVYKGRVLFLPDEQVHVSNEPLIVKDEVLFAKYSPDTHEIELEGKKVKFVLIDDILAIL